MWCVDVRERTHKRDPRIDSLFYFKQRTLLFKQCCNKMRKRLLSEHSQYSIWYFSTSPRSLCPFLSRAALSMPFFIVSIPIKYSQSVLDESSIGGSALLVARAPWRRGRKRECFLHAFCVCRLCRVSPLSGIASRTESVDVWLRHRQHQYHFRPFI